MFSELAERSEMGKWKTYPQAHRVYEKEGKKGVGWDAGKRPGRRQGAKPPARPVVTRLSI